MDSDEEEEGGEAAAAAAAVVVSRVWVAGEAPPPLETVLKAVFGFSVFRAGQRDIVTAVLAGRDAFGLMATGAGKSLTYCFPSVYKRAVDPNHRGTTLVVSPLLSLMQDQVMALSATAVRACALNSSTRADAAMWHAATAFNGAYHVVFTTPETLMSMLHVLKGAAARGAIDLVAIDEAHTVSEWGLDFRPEYRRLSVLRTELPGVPILALTATATPRAQGDILRVLNLRAPVQVITTFNRPNLHYLVARKAASVDADLHDALLGPARALTGSTIVYVSTQKETEAVAARIRALGIAGATNAAAYHGGMDPAQRSKVHVDFVHDRVRVVVATIAFGMGIDKKDVRCIVHYGLPKSLEAYYQQTGRAGRDGDPARCVLLWAPGDVATHQRLISMSANDNDTGDAAARRTRLQWSLDGLTAMHNFASGRACRRDVVLGYFGEGPPPEGCTGCDVCDGVARGGGSKGQGQAAVTPPLMHDFTSDVRPLLQALAFCEGRTGLNLAVDILRGSASVATTRYLHGRAPPCYGAGRSKPQAYFLALARDVMVPGGLAEPRMVSSRAGGKTSSYTAFALTVAGEAMLHDASAKAVAAVTDELRAFVAPPPSGVPAAGSLMSLFAAAGATSGALALTAEEERGFRALEDTRGVLAACAGVAAYIVCSNAVLRTMVRSRPATVAELSRIEGMDEARATRFGAELLTTLHDVMPPTTRAGAGAGAAAAITAWTHAPAPAKGTRWDAAEDARLLAAFQQRTAMAQIAASHGRTAGAIQARAALHVRQLSEAGVPADAICVRLNFTLPDVTTALHGKNPSLKAYRA